MNNYIINNETLLLIPYGKGKTKVFEFDRNFIINETSGNIIKNSCLFFGSSLEGRREAVKYILNINMKIPILVEDMKNMIFFPVSNCINKNSIWISYQNLLKYCKFNEFSTVLYFKNNEEVKVDVKYNLIDNQVIRCIKLESLLNKRRNFLKFESSITEDKNAFL